MPLGAAMLCRILLALCVLAIVSGARAQEAITIDTFESRFRSNPFGKDIVPGPFICKSGAVVVCESTVRSGNAKADITVRGDLSTRAVTKVGVMVPHPKLARDRVESARISILYALLTVKIATALNPELSESDAIDKMAQLQKGAHRLDNDLQLGSWKYSAADGVIILGFGAERVLPVAAGPPPATQEQAWIEGGNALACRDRADNERVLATVRRFDEAAYRKVIAELIITGRCTQIDHGSQIIVLERYAPTDMARVRKVGDQQPYWINGFYAKK